MKCISGAKMIIGAIRVDFRESDTSSPKTISIGETTIDSSYDSTTDGAEMKALMEHDKEMVNSVPTIIRGISNALAAEVDTWIDCGRRIKAAEREEQLDSLEHRTAVKAAEARLNATAL